jgi:hypothetical protein
MFWRHPLPPSSEQKKEAVGSSETLITTYQGNWCCITNITPMAQNFSSKVAPYSANKKLPPKRLS